MAEKDQVLEEKVEHSGIFDFPNLYLYAHSWFKEEEYGVNEDKYSEKVSGNKREISIRWKATKDMSDYFKFEMKVKFEIAEMTDVEVEIDGEKKKMNKGKLSIEIGAILIKDKDGKWENSPFNRFMRDVYNKYIIPSRVNNMENKLRVEAINFKEEVKAFLELKGKR